jgi:hypothetical protein
MMLASAIMSARRPVVFDDAITPSIDRRAHVNGGDIIEIAQDGASAATGLGA